MYLWVIVLTLLISKPVEDSTLYTSSLPVVEIKSKLPARGDCVLLAKLINAEAPYEPYEGQWAVASVVRNRMEFSSKSALDVIFQPGQFDGIHSKRFSIWTREQYRIAFRVLVKNERNLPKSVLFFHNKKTSTDQGWVKTLARYEFKLIGNHMFCHSKYLL